MKKIVVLFALIAAVLARPETYDTRYDDFDITEIKQNSRLRKSYGLCLVGTSPCTPEGAEFRKNMPEALKTECAKCTLKQRQLIREFANVLREKNPDIWKQLQEQQDPNGEYREKFESFLKAKD